MARRVASGLAGLASAARLQLRRGSAVLRGITVATESSERDTSDAVRRSTPAASTSHDDDTPLAKYRRRVSSGALLGGDESQINALKELGTLRDRVIRRFSPDGSGEHGTNVGSMGHQTMLREILLLTTDGEKNKAQGVYLHGGVGRGKTMLMDLFFSTLPDEVKRRTRRTHFHEFMASIHQKLHGVSSYKTRVQFASSGDFFQIGRSSSSDGSSGSATAPTSAKTRSDPLATVAFELFQTSPILCFDEVELSDVADALVFKRVFEIYFNLGGFVVSTSNSAPSKLYDGGINRAAFVPFIETLMSKTTVVSLDVANTTGEGSSTKNNNSRDELRFDYRRLMKNRTENEKYSDKSNARPSVAAGVRSVLLVTPSTSDDVKAKHLIDAKLRELFESTTPGDTTERVLIPIAAGRFLSVESRGTSCFISFAELCGVQGTLGASDYVKLLERYDSVCVTDVPKFTLQNENEARRFVNFIDIAYEHRGLLIASMPCAPEGLFQLDEPHSSSTSSGSEKGESMSVRARVGMEGKRGNFKVTGTGGSSGRSTPTVGDMEWSATGRAGASLADLQHSNFTFKAGKRCVSRLVEMGSAAYEQRWLERKLSESQPE